MTLIQLLMSDLNRYRRIYGASEARSRWNALRCFVNPRILPAALYRISHALHSKGWEKTSKAMGWINFYVNGIEIYSVTTIGPGLFLPHASGTVIGAFSIGSNATIYHHVTLGGKRLEMGIGGRPTIGDNVVIGAGATILGEISVGDNAVVCANSLVLESVEGGQVVIGVPAIRKVKPSIAG